MSIIILILDLLMLIYWAHEWAKTESKWPVFMMIFMFGGIICLYLNHCIN